MNNQRIVLIVGAVVAALLLFLLGRDEPAVEAPAPAAAIEPREHRIPATAPELTAAAPASGSQPDPLSPIASQEADLIDTVELSVAEPCAHEPTTVTVNAHNTEDLPGYRPDADLSFRVLGQRGNPVVLSFPEPGEYPISVLVTNRPGWGDFDTHRQTITVRDCGDRAFAAITPRHLEGHRYGFQVARAGRAPAPFTGEAVYRWDFGDGTEATTRQPFVEHDYTETRPMDRIDGNMVVTVLVETRDGPLRGATSLIMPNLYLQSKLQAGTLTPDVIMGPARVKGRTVYADATVINYEDQQLVLDQIQARVIACDQSDPPPELRLAAASVLSTAALAPGRSQLQVRFAAGGAADACRVLLTATGRAPSGEDILLDLPLEVESMVPSQTLSSRNPTERKKVEQIKAAIVELGRQDDPNPRVSDAELDWLIAQGRI